VIIETIGEPQGFDAAIYGMRNPMNSWNLSDSELLVTQDSDNYEVICEKFIIGEKDKELSLKLQKAGPEHCKHLRMIYVWADISAPRYWWTEFDTYRIGVEKVSCSTMHKLMARPLTKDDFEHDCMNDAYLNNMIESINSSMEAWRLCKDEDHKKEIWRGIIQALPQSYLQMRTVCMSYAALRNIVRQRAGHKLYEWQQFIDWCKSLPEAYLIFDGDV
jgi:hypothetical protein